jgi:hypothetical protein
MNKLTALIARLQAEHPEMTLADLTVLSASNDPLRIALNPRIQAFARWIGERLREIKRNPDLQEYLQRLGRYEFGKIPRSRTSLLLEHPWHAPAIQN